MLLSKFHFERSLKSEKNSQIFMFDMIFSVVIIIVSLGIVFSYFNETSTNVDIYDLNFQILNSMTQTEINSLNDVEIRKFFISGKIKNIHNTIAQQVSEFYYFNNLTEARNLTSFFIKNYEVDNLNYKINLYNGSSSVQLVELINRPQIKLENSKISSITKRNVIGFINQYESYGPYEVEVIIWT